MLLWLWFVVVAAAAVVVVTAVVAALKLGVTSLESICLLSFFFIFAPIFLLSHPVGDNACIAEHTSGQTECGVNFHRNGVIQ